MFISSLINKIPGVNISTFAYKRFPRLATGTNYVEKEGLAYIHEGEAVVPKKYNPAIAGGGSTTVHITMPDIYMDNDKVGRAVTPIVSKTLRLGGAY